MSCRSLEACDKREAAPRGVNHGSVQGWNLRHLDSLLSRTLEKKKLAIPGVSTPYLYFGMWRSIFAWCAHAALLCKPSARSGSRGN